MAVDLIADKYIAANWPAANNVHAYVTTRKNGLSTHNFGSFNLADHVGDNPQIVNKNRLDLKAELALKSNPFWLQQTHSNHCLQWQQQPSMEQADASFSVTKNQICAVLTADCLPILLVNRQANWVAACHAGWRGLAAGVIENTIDCYQGNKSDLIGWIGPAISQPYFEVGNEVKSQFVALNSDFEEYFAVNQRNRFQCDFTAIAVNKLNSLGVETFTSNLCSFAEPDKFYSYRRDGETGRMASLIWFD